jgi:actin-related protein 6
LNNERISVPEVLFHPSDIGLNQAGISESVVQSVESLDSPIEKSVMYDTILLVGGNSLFKNCLIFISQRNRQRKNGK